MSVKITRGNRTLLKMKLLRDGVLVDNLASFTRIVFAVKVTPSPAAPSVILLESLTGAPNPKLPINTPDTGYVTAELDSADTAVSPGEYVFALQVEWGADDKLEWKFGDGKLKIEQDVIA